jgi:5-hydroxyisourate hydrolase
VAPAVVVSIRDGVYGRPAAGVPVRVEGASATGEALHLAGATDDDGQCTHGLAQFPVPGRCRLAVDPAGYYATLGMHSQVAELVVVVPLRGDVDTQRVTLVIAPYWHAMYLDA